MKILVCISKTPDTTSKIAFKDNQSKYDDNGVQWILNPYDEWYALVRAIEIKEANPDTVLHIAMVGLADAEPIIRKAFALGGDAGFRINLQSDDSMEVAWQLAELVKKENYDLVFTGKETIDYNSGIVGGLLAEMVDMPYVSLASKFDINQQTATIHRDIEGGVEVVEVTLPVVVSCQKGVAEQRIPNMRGIMASRTKPLQVVEPSSLSPNTQVVQYELPPARQSVKLIAPDNVKELARILKEEVKAF